MHKIVHQWVMTPKEKQVEKKSREFGVGRGLLRGGSAVRTPQEVSLREVGGGKGTDSPGLPRTEGIPRAWHVRFKIKTVPGKQGLLVTLEQGCLTHPHWGPHQPHS